MLSLKRVWGWFLGFLKTLALKGLGLELDLDRPGWYWMMIFMDMDATGLRKLKGLGAVSSRKL